MTINSIRCPRCHCGHSSVTHTQHQTIKIKGTSRQVIRRRRVCRYCGRAFFTTETYESDIDREKARSQPETSFPNPYLC